MRLSMEDNEPDEPPDDDDVGWTWSGLVAVGALVCWRGGGTYMPFGFGMYIAFDVSFRASLHSLC